MKEYIQNLFNRLRQHQETMEQFDFLTEDQMNIVMERINNQGQTND